MHQQSHVAASRVQWGWRGILRRYASSCKQTGAGLLLAALKESAKQSVIQAIPPPNKEAKLFQAMYQIWLNKFSVLKIRISVRQICMRFKLKYKTAARSKQTIPPSRFCVFINLSPFGYNLPF